MGFLTNRKAGSGAGFSVFPYRVEILVEIARAGIGDCCKLFHLNNFSRFIISSFSVFLLKNQKIPEGKYLS